MPHGRAFATGSYQVLDLEEERVVFTRPMPLSLGLALGPEDPPYRYDPPEGSLPPLVIPCDGDCNEDEQVDVSEVIRAVRLALDSASVESCRAADVTSDDQVRIIDLVAIVRTALQGCVPCCALPCPLPGRGPDPHCAGFAP